MSAPLVVTKLRRSDVDAARHSATTTTGPRRGSPVLDMAVVSGRVREYAGQ